MTETNGLQALFLRKKENRIVLTFSKKSVLRASKILIFKMSRKLFFIDLFDKYLLQNEVQKKREKGSGADVEYWLLRG